MLSWSVYWSHIMSCEVYPVSQMSENLSISVKHLKYSQMPLKRSAIYRKVSNIRRTLVGNKSVDHSDVVGASPAGAAPTTSSFSTYHLVSMDWAKITARRDEKHSCFGIEWVLY